MPRSTVRFRPNFARMGPALTSSETRNISPPISQKAAGTQVQTLAGQHGGTQRGSQRGQIPAAGRWRGASALAASPRTPPGTGTGAPVAAASTARYQMRGSGCGGGVDPPPLWVETRGGGAAKKCPKLCFRRFFSTKLTKNARFHGGSGQYQCSLETLSSKPFGWGDMKPGKTRGKTK